MDAREWGINMLKRFEVENFKGFRDTLSFDLTAREYAFNRGLTVDGIVNKAIVYGKNGIGKSCLGFAIFDIVWHLTDKERMPSKSLSNYINLDSGLPCARFKYFFQFDDDEIVYEYHKTNPNNLVDEKIWINGRLVLDYVYTDRDRQFVDQELCGNLKIELVDNKLSVVKYIFRNTPTDYQPVFTKMIRFCEGMLWYRSLSEGNMYCGFTNGSGNLMEKLYESGKLHDFEAFLEENEVPYRLKFVASNGGHELMALFDDGKAMTPFWSVISTGTAALLLYYVWSISFDSISLLFIDEFDAFFHFEAAERIILRLNKARGFQTILTSHNTYLMQNRLTRPDCCFIMTRNRITSLYNSTDKEIREAHNLEKMYVNGVFNE